MFLSIMVQGTLSPKPTMQVWRRCWIISFLALLVQGSVATSHSQGVQKKGYVNSLHSHPTKLDWYLHGHETNSSRHLFTDDSTASKCQAVRPVDEYYTAELQLYYVYAVEFAAHAKSRSLAGLEAVITTAISESLADFCDEMDRPMYKVLTTMRHQFSKDAFCAPLTEGNTCSVVNGATAILLDDRSSHIEDIVYEAIANGLRDPVLLEQFSPSVVQADFQASLGESLIVAPSPLAEASPGPITAAVAVAAASVSFVVASIFCYGMMRRHIRHHPEPSVRYRFQRRTGIKPSLPSGLPRTRRRFVRLDERSHPSDEDEHDHDDDDDIEVESQVEDYSNHDPPVIARSISDITSDSASHVSAVSWSTNRLERIDEGEEEEDMEALPNRKRKRRKWKSSSSDRSCRSFEMVGLETSISPMDDEMGELAGCRYVPEPCAYICSQSYPITSHILPVMPEVDDLQVSLDEEDDPMFASDQQPPGGTGHDGTVPARVLVSNEAMPPHVKVGGQSIVPTDAPRGLVDNEQSSDENGTCILVDDKQDTMVLPSDSQTAACGAALEHEIGRVNSASEDYSIPHSDVCDDPATPKLLAETLEAEMEIESTTSYCTCRELPSPMPEASTPIFLTPLLKSVVGMAGTDSPSDLVPVTLTDDVIDRDEGIPQEIVLETCGSMAPASKDTDANGSLLTIKDSVEENSMNRSRHTV